MPVNPVSETKKVFNFKLVSFSGLEYLLVSIGEWNEVLKLHCWEEVEVLGPLNIRDISLIPQKIFPKEPTGENVIHLNRLWQSKDLAKKWVISCADLKPLFSSYQAQQFC